MKYEGLFEDFNNVRTTQAYAVGKVIDEAQNYIEYLEGREDVLNNILNYLDEIDGNNKFESKKEILEAILKFIPEEVNA